MTDDDKKLRNQEALEWEKIRSRTILTAFQTGRPVFANTEGELRYADGDCEPVGDEVGVPKAPLPDATVKISWWARLKRRFGRSAS